MIPDFQTIMLPLLKILQDGKNHSLRDIISKISDQFNLTEEERVQLLPSANQAIINNRVGCIYIQAKRWDNTVTIHQVRDFAGSLLSKKAKKGIFITTSSYPASAREFVSSIEPKIVLIDGNELANLMIEYKVGISVKKVYEVQRLDSDYFEEV